MIKHFGVPTTDIAFYVGITFGCFSLSQFLTGIFWGRTSDKFGRKPIILMGMSGTLISILIFGFSVNIYMAIFARCFSGLVNGNVHHLGLYYGSLDCADELPILGWDFTNNGRRDGSREGGIISRASEILQTTTDHLRNSCNLVPSLSCPSL